MRLFRILSTLLSRVALMGAGCSLLICLFWLGVGIASPRGPFYFPGDPPYLEAGLFYVLIALLLSGVHWLLRRTAGPDPTPRKVFLLIAPSILSISGICFLVCVLGIGFRLSPPWLPVRAGIRSSGDAILAASGGDRTRTLSLTEFTTLKARFMPTPVAVQLRGFGTVHLRMAHGVYPYVGVDFGEGMNALFDPRTMLCTYSD